jgi:hypothetical protein
LETKFAVDGTGFGTSVYNHYRTQKNGPKVQRRKPTKRSRWVERKIVLGTLTHCVAAAQITE